MGKKNQIDNMETNQQTPDSDAANGNSSDFFRFFKGADDIAAPKDGIPFDPVKAASRVREQLGDAMNARNVSFLLGSGCSSFVVDKSEVGVPTMGPMASAFLSDIAAQTEVSRITEAEKSLMKERLGIDIGNTEYTRNLERLLEVLFCLQFGLKNATKVEALNGVTSTVDSLIKKTTHYILKTCTTGAFSIGDNTVLDLYQAFYRKLVYRDRSLPRPWIFTSNYDLFSETAMDRLSIPYCNGFLGSVERRFNPATFRYSLAEQLDISTRKWTAVDGFVYLCKLHGSVNWTEESTGLFPIREHQNAPLTDDRVVIYPTPTKQNASFSSPYADLFREFQRQIVQEQSVLFVLGYGFGDEHINNIIFQALTVPTFRLVAFVQPDHDGVIAQLRNLRDPRIWLIGSEGAQEENPAHFFGSFVERFMPQLPSDKIDSAVERVIKTLVSGSDAGAVNAD